MSAEPGVAAFDLDGSEDYLVLGCDGLWDVFTHDEIVHESYNYLQLSTGSKANLSVHLSDRAREKGSTDNITVVVVFLRDVIAPPAPADSTQSVPIAAQEDDQISGSHKSDSSSTGSGDSGCKPTGSGEVVAAPAGGSGEAGGAKEGDAHEQWVANLQRRGLRFLPSLPQRPLACRRVTSQIALKFHPKTNSPLKQVRRVTPPSRLHFPRSDVTIQAAAAAVTNESVVSVSLHLHDVIQQPLDDVTRSRQQEQMLDECLSTAMQLVSHTAEVVRANRRQRKSTTRQRLCVEDGATTSQHAAATPEVTESARPEDEGRPQKLSRLSVRSATVARPSVACTSGNTVAVKNNTWPLSERKRDLRMRTGTGLECVTFAAVAGFAHFAGDVSDASSESFFKMALPPTRDGFTPLPRTTHRTNAAQLCLKYRSLSNRKQQPMTSRACAPAARSTWTLAHEIRAFSLC